jgi:hypothetical protein
MLALAPIGYPIFVYPNADEIEIQPAQLPTVPSRQATAHVDNTQLVSGTDNT